MLKTILDTGRFYARCARWAASGTLEIANAWFWVLGVPVVAATGYVLKIGPRTVPDHFPEFLLFMFATVGASWIIVFLVRLLRAPVYFMNEMQGKIEHQCAELAKLNERMQPQIKVFIDEKTHGVTTAPTEAGSAQTNTGVRVSIKGPESKWIQISVACATDAPLSECQVWLTNVQKMADDGSLGPELVEEHVACLWSQSDTTKTTIHPKRIQRANLFSLYDSGMVQPWTQPIKLTLREAIKIPGAYRIELIVTADNAPTEEGRYIFTWRDFSDVTMRVA